jgi:hypothetical protein
LALPPLRAYRRRLARRPVVEVILSFQIKAIGDQNSPREVFATTPDESIAQASIEVGTHVQPSVAALALATGEPQAEIHLVTKKE